MSFIYPESTKTMNWNYKILCILLSSFFLFDVYYHYLLFFKLYSFSSTRSIITSSREALTNLSGLAHFYLICIHNSNMYFSLIWITESCACFLFTTSWCQKASGAKWEKNTTVCHISPGLLILVFPRLCFCPLQVTCTSFVVSSWIVWGI